MMKKMGDSKTDALLQEIKYYNDNFVNNDTAASL